jgi:chitinase
VDNIQVLVPGDQAPGFSVNDVRLAEGNAGTTQAVFTVTRSSGAGQASVRYATADGSSTAAAGDYQAVSGTLTFSPGETRKTVAVPVAGDRLGESDESFVLNLTSPTGTGIADGQGRAHVRDDEPRVHATGQIVLHEGDAPLTLEFTIHLSAPSSQPVTVHYATADLTATAGTDYLPACGVLTFAPGETRKVIALTLPRDRTQDALLEAFAIDLSDASTNAVILKRGVVHIVDDDKNQGNHSGYRNQYGGAASVAGWGAAAAGPAREIGVPASSPVEPDRAPNDRRERKPAGGPGGRAARRLPAVDMARRATAELAPAPGHRVLRDLETPVDPWS